MGGATTTLRSRMRNLIDDLRREHDDLRTALQVLGTIAERVAAGSAFPSDDVAVLLRYLRDFVVGVHFAKEAHSLLRDVAVHGTDAEAELAGAVLRAQDDVRTMLHSLVLFWEPCGQLNEAERSGFVAAARGLVRLLERALRLEEHGLFPAADHVPGDDRLGWQETCRQIEAQRPQSSDWHRELAQLGWRWS